MLFIGVHKYNKKTDKRKAGPAGTGYKMHCTIQAGYSTQYTNVTVIKPSGPTWPSVSVRVCGTAPSQLPG